MEIADYSYFADKCMEELKLLQEKLYVDYDLNGYESWYYDESTGLLTLSSKNKELNFKYFSVGSYFAKASTWKWSWDNEGSLPNVNKKSRIIKEFGQKSEFGKLTDGFFQSNEIEAWEFAAIGVKLGNGIGVYRPVNDNGLQMFFVITEFVDNETADKIKDKYVLCNVHSSGRMSFICKHLNLNDKVGFEEAFETVENMELEEDDDFQAWCDDCEIVRQGEDGWNDASMAYAEIKIVCETCYFNIKEFNLGYR